MLVLLLAMLPLFSAMAQSGESGPVFCLTDDLLVPCYDAANSSAAAVAFFPENTWLEVIGRSRDRLEVRDEQGRRGWIASGNVRYPEIKWGSVGIVSLDTRDSYLNLRAEPSYQSEVLARYRDGTPCRFLSYQNDWYQVSVDGKTGYFRKEYLHQVYTGFSEDLCTLSAGGDSPLRTGPGAGYEALDMPKGALFGMILVRGIDWTCVSVNGAVCYVRNEALQEGLADSAESAASRNGTAEARKPRQAAVSGLDPTQVLNLRSDPRLDAAVVTQFGNGAGLTVLKPGTEWCKVVSEQGHVGYVMTAYLSQNESDGAPTMTVAQPQHTFANLRSTPDMDADNVIAEIPDGETVTVMIPGDSWVQVQWNGLTGYVAVYLLK